MSEKAQRIMESLKEVDADFRKHLEYLRKLDEKLGKKLVREVEA